MVKFCYLLTIASISWAAFNSMNPASAQPVNSWYPECVRAPLEITRTNKATIKSEDCMTRQEQFIYQGNTYSGHSYRFRDGEVINYFMRECADRFGPCGVKFSVSSNKWSDGVWSFSDTTAHKCGDYQCNWYIVRDPYGRLVLATGMSY